FTMLRIIPRLAEIITREKIDIVHARSRVPAWIAYFSCLLTHTIFITTCHGYYAKHLFTKVMGWGQRVIVLSNVIARHMIEDFGVPYQRIRLVPRSVDLEKFEFISPEKKRKGEIHVGIIGRITPLKGHMPFIKAMARVIRAIPSLKIWVVGDAPPSKETYKEELQVLVRRLGLWDHTEFLGTQRDIPEVLSHLDVLVLATTTHEAFGRVIIEAQAAGVPVVATEVGGVIDVIEHEKTGLLVQPSDPVSMAEAVIRIVQDPVFARDLAENAYKKVKKLYHVERMVKNTLDVYEDAMKHRKILIIKFSSLGDVILSTAALRQLRKKFDKSYSISLLTSEENKDVLLRCPYIDELLVADFNNKDKGFYGLMRLGHFLRKKQFDIVFDLQNNRKSHLLAYYSGAYHRYGYDNKKFSFLLNHRIPDDKPPIDPVTHQFRVLKMAGVTLEDPHLELWPSEEDRQSVDEFLSAEWLSAAQKIVGINLSASRRWLTKSWPMPQLVKFCEELGRRDIRVVLTGSASDREAAESLVARAKGAKLINMCARTSINQLACLIKRCDVYVSADSSPLHVSAAMEIPFVSLFGPTDPRRHMPPAKNFILIRKNIPCSPCYRPKCSSKKCMAMISSDEVIGAVEKLLKV
ncbi:MAG: lipopolysaccharide heptosyltransferase II, partial [Candidatus Omnitrophica bacterium]|nr:lipopolysaccharide heptosyltransferase II [Candidatus Omnitrophota bacterium]